MGPTGLPADGPEPRRRRHRPQGPPRFAEPRLGVEGPEGLAFSPEPRPFRRKRYQSREAHQAREATPPVDQHGGQGTGTPLPGLVELLVARPQPLQQAGAAAHGVLQADHKETVDHGGDPHREGLPQAVDDRGDDTLQELQAAELAERRHVTLQGEEGLLRADN